MLTSRRRSLGLLLATLLLLLAGGLGAPASADDEDVPTFPSPTPGLPWFGAQLDWLQDSADDYEQRLGSSAALYGQRVAYPLDQDATYFLERLVTQSAAQGAVPVLSLEPTVPLEDLTTADAEAMVEELAGLSDELGTRYLLRFAPEMNGTWYAWGQQPTAYVAAFRLLADVVHDRLPEAAMVWSPVYGAGYPYGAAYGDVDPDRVADVDALDTDGNRRLDEGDDPYGPFWPGPDAVDWVGLTLYHFGPDRGRVDNEVEDPVQGGETGDEETSTGFETDVAPRDGAFRSRMLEVYGYPDGSSGRDPFYERFAVPDDLPMLVDTGAVWLPDPEGDPEVDIKRTWWRQVLKASRDFPQIGGILWLEERRPEAEVQDRLVDWRATRTADLARVLLRDLEDTVDLGPVTPPVEAVAEDEDGAGSPGAGEGPSPDPGLATAVEVRPEPLWLAVAAWSLLVLAGLALLAGRLRPGWRVPPLEDDAAGRDPRLDVARGVLLVGLVAAHVELLATSTGPAARLLGAVTGPEAFVLLAGLAMGLRHAGIVERGGELAAVSARWKRAFSWWGAVVLTSLVVLGLRYLPGSADAAVTHWPPGPGGTDLYVDSAPLLDYPPPWWAVRELFVLRTIPWPLSLVGLLVALAVVAPVLLAIVRRGGWWLVLSASWATYVAGLSWVPDWTSGTWEASYPPLLWQLPLVHGLVLAHHRRDLAALLARPWLRRSAVALGALALAAWAGVTTWAVVADGDVASTLVDLTDGRDLPIGRVVLLALVALVAWLLLTCAGPLVRLLDPVLGWLGRHAVPVLAAHVLLLVGVAAVWPGYVGWSG